ncbi:MAG: cytoskeleton protein RodZ [Gammaproteobacteria bacterium]|nr:MAG: cytoskeleton protein RodZ [Gammaproteobacteria bacterium]
MTEDILQPDEEIEQNRTLVLGWRLRFAREALRLEVDDIAAELHLSSSTIVAIEEDDYSSIPPIYACGYLRKYARIVKLSEDEIIAEFEEKGEELPPVLSEVIVRSREPVDKKSIAWITYAIVAVLVALFVAWWQTAPEDNAVSRFLNLDKTQTEAHVTSGTAAIKVTTDQALVDELEKAEAMTSINESISVIALDEIEKQQIRAGASQARGGLEPPDRILDAAKIVTPGSVQSATKVVAPDIDDAITDQATITLYLKEDSWIGVTDSTGKRLVYDLYKKGRTRTAQGIPPFSVVLGSSDNVVINYKGRLYEHKKYRSSSGTARFVLGE